MIYLPLLLLPTRYLPASFLPDDGRRYHVYSRAQREDLGDDELVGIVPRDASGGSEYSLLLTGDPDTTRFVYVRAVNALGREDDEPVAPKLREIRYDGDGELVVPVPNVPIAVRLRAAAGGEVLAAWEYIAHLQPAAPAGFNVYVATAGDPMDFGAPAHQAASSAREQSLGTFAHGTLVRAVVRAVSAEGGETVNTDEVEIHADALAPAAPGALTVEVA